MVQRRKKPHIEGLATHDDPEPCGHARKGVPEALVGAHAGRVLSREIEFKIQVPSLFPGPKATLDALQEARCGETWRGLRGDPEHAWKHHAREPGDPATARGDGAAGRDGKSEDAIHRCTEQGV
jgi:hypothetical protein